MSFRFCYSFGGNGRFHDCEDLFNFEFLWF